ncbi:glutaredoxin 3 [Moorella thermoacetica]|uniref:Glutaredoxin 3 n=1 Tax=Neomoorella thermoacetica TaxID=1525 RepID=A0A1J5P715_NEOTH|nr:glutaredoxin 3 [Moorella thermoacetica]
MKEYLSRHGVAYEEKDITTDEQARKEMYRRTGQTAVPTLVVRDQVMVGFDETRLRKILH